MEVNLRKHVLAPWYPRAVDRRYGGFQQNFAEDWSPEPDGSRSLVYQCRLTWVAAQAARRYPEEAEFWLPMVRHGWEALSGPLWDADHGGWYWELGYPSGQPDAGRGTEKHAYGIAFGIYAASAVYHSTGEAAALRLAQDAFRWLETHAHDSQHGGYLEALSRFGEPLLSETNGRKTDAIGTVYGRKSMNGHLHLLEAFTALFQLWPDAALRERLEELFHLTLKRIASRSGYLRQFFRTDWRPVLTLASYGHDLEAAYLLTGTARVLGAPGDASTWQSARRLVDRSLRCGWDRISGGFFDAGIPQLWATRRQKTWWAQAEGLNALQLMDQRFGSEDRRYGEAFRRQWEFIERCQVDHRHGGWHSEIAADGSVASGQRKSHPWKDPYHQARALWEVSDRLRIMPVD